MSRTPDGSGVIEGFSAAQVRAAEAPSLAAGVPLMQRAADGLAREIRTLLPATGGRVLILAGGGDNGGDALFAGARLAAAGAEVAIVPTSRRIHGEGLSAALAAGARREGASDAARLAAAADVVVDGILGTGTSTDAGLRGTARAVVSALLPVVEGGGTLVVAVDIPSGVHPDDGSVPDPVVLPATVTMTFGARKAGLLIPPGSGYAGQVRLVDIGLGEEFARMMPVVRV